MEPSLTKRALAGEAVEHRHRLRRPAPRARLGHDAPAPGEQRADRRLHRRQAALLGEEQGRHGIARHLKRHEGVSRIRRRRGADGLAALAGHAGHHPARRERRLEQARPLARGAAGVGGGGHAPHFAAEQRGLFPAQREQCRG